LSLAAKPVDRPGARQVDPPCSRRSPLAHNPDRPRQHLLPRRASAGSAPAAFMALLKGANFGKQLVRVGPDKA